MKRLTLSINEFLQFRITCEFYKIKFTYQITAGQAIVRADREQLKTIGF